MTESPPPQEPEPPDAGPGDAGEGDAEPQPAPPDEPVSEPDVEGDRASESAFADAPNVDGHAPERGTRT